MVTSAVFGAGFVIFILFVFVIGVGSVALWIWGLIDAATRPDWVFERGQSSKVMWVVLIAVLGAIPAIIYLASVRPRLVSVQDSAHMAGWGQAGAGGSGGYDWSTSRGWEGTPGWSTGVATGVPVAGSAGSPGAPSGWYDDPGGRHRMRYWDGTAWTASVWDGGPVMTDPFPG